MAQKIKLENDLYERVKKVAEVAGYASADEFIIHMIEKELQVLENPEDNEDITERLRGLGYLE